MFKESNHDSELSARIDNFLAAKLGSKGLADVEIVIED